jgi:hypothetical protein
VRLRLRRGRHPAPLDRGGRGPGLKTRPHIALGGVAFILAAGAAPAPALKALAWLAPGHDVVAALGFQPPECLRPSPDPDIAWRVEVGRTAFRTPLTLGGQAARAGISCETCHRNGRSNPDFRFPGVSGLAGTADVTSSLFSSHRGNGVDDPRPIPDLGGPKAALKIDQSPDAKALEPFIHGLVTQEFDGAEPPPAVLAGLAAYVRALDPTACPAGDRQRPLRAGDYAADTLRAEIAAEGGLDRQDPATALAMLGAARSRLGALAERYDRSPQIARRLARSSHDLDAAEGRIRAGDPDAARAALTRWRDGWPAVTGALASQENRSLFDPARLSSVPGLPSQGS